MNIEKIEISEKLNILKVLKPSKSDTSTSGILLENGKLMATNFEMSATADIECDLTENFVIPADAIDYINSLPNGNINIEYDGKKVTVESKNSKCAFQSIKPADYIIPENLKKKEQYTETCIFERDELFTAINSVIYACDLKSTRETQKGLLFCADGCNLNIVAADMHRIAKTTIPCDKVFKIIIPKESLQKASSILDGDKITFNVNKNTISLANDSYKLTLRAIAGEFLKYESIFPQKYESKFMLDRKAAIQTFNRAMLCSSGKPLFTKLTSNGDSLVVHLEGGINDFTEELLIDSKNTDDLIVGINPRLLLECFKAVDCEKVEVRYINSLSPLAINAGKVSAVILPVRLNR